MPMITPIWYHYRKGDSDRDWIANMFYFIPEQYHQKVADRYEIIFRDDKARSRERANKFLHRIASRFRK